MRLIDADALFKEFERAAWYYNVDRDEIAEEILLQMPTIDAVEVVRCKDCKYGRLDDYTLKMFCSSPLGSYGCTPTQANNFCSYGERRE